MPCNSDYMDASSFEINMSEVLLLLDELNTGKPVDPDSSAWRGYDKRVYNNHGLSKADLDGKVAELCARLKQTDVTKHSLEMQLWWREHQKADAARLAKEKAAAEKAELRKKALSKLTPAERKALGAK